MSGLSVNINVLYKWIYVLFAFTLIFLDVTPIKEPLHIKLATFGVLIIVCLLAKETETINSRFHFIIIFLTGYSLLVGAFSNDYVEFVKSFIYQTLFFIVLLLATGKQNTKLLLAHKRVFNFVIVLTVAHSIFLISQFVLFNYLDNMGTLNPFGDWSGKGPDIGAGDEASGIYFIHPFVTVKRPNGFFGEPSYAAIYSVIIYTLIIYFSKDNLKKYTLPLIIITFGILATVSLYGITALLLANIYYLFLMPKRRDEVVLKRITLALFVVMLLFGYIKFSERVGEFTTAQSSAYFRVTGPILLLGKAIYEKPFGIPLGDELYSLNSGFLSSIDDARSGKIDNSLFSFLFHYGVVGWSILVLFLGWLINIISRRPREGLVYVTLLISFTASGSGFTPRFIILIVFSLLTISAYRRNISL